MPRKKKLYWKDEHNEEMWTRSFLLLFILFFSGARFLLLFYVRSVLTVSVFIFRFLIDPRIVTTCIGRKIYWFFLCFLFLELRLLLYFSYCYYYCLMCVTLAVQPFYFPSTNRSFSVFPFGNYVFCVYI